MLEVRERWLLCACGADLLEVEYEDGEIVHVCECAPKWIV